MQISLQLQNTSCRQAVGHTKLKGYLAPTKEQFIETKKRIVKRFQKGNLQSSVVKDVGCSCRLCLNFCAIMKKMEWLQMKHTKTIKAFEYKTPNNIPGK